MCRYLVLEYFFFTLWGSCKDIIAGNNKGGDEIRLYICFVCGTLTYTENSVAVCNQILTKTSGELITSSTKQYYTACKLFMVGSKWENPFVLHSSSFSESSFIIFQSSVCFMLLVYPSQKHLYFTRFSILKTLCKQSLIFDHTPAINAPNK